MVEQFILGPIGGQTNETMGHTGILFFGGLRRIH